MATKILFLSDLHCGHRFGLTPPFYQRDKYKMIQDPLWRAYREVLREIGSVDILIGNGDLVEGEGKKENIEIEVTDTKEQAEMAAECMSSIKAKEIHFTYGTPYHVVGTYSYEETVADLMAATIDDHLLLKVNGVKLSVRHVGGRSDTPYGQGTQIQKEIVRESLRALQADREMADWVIRGHVHYWIKLEIQNWKGIQLPCLKIPSEIFSRKLRTMYYTLGVALATIPTNGRGADIVKHEIPLHLVHNEEFYVWQEKQEDTKSKKS